MLYFDIHTHRQTEHSDSISIVNTVVREEMEENLSHYRSYGIHPWYIENIQEQIDRLYEFAHLPQTIAVGEAGLDKLSETAMEKQSDVFRQQVLIAEEVRKPLIIHCVKAWEELLAIRKELSPEMPWIIHGFRGNKQLAGQLTAHDFYLSFGALFNEEALKQVNPERIFAETDDKEVDIRQVYRQLAETLKMPLDVFASGLAENVGHIFSLK